MKRFLAVYTICIVAVAVFAWQTAPAETSAIIAPVSTPTIDDYAWLLSVTVVKALSALLVLLLCAYIAARIWERLRWATVDDYGRLPFRRRYLEEEPELAVEALAAYHGTERARAEHQTPARLTYSPHLRLMGTAAAPAMLEEHTPAGAPTFAQLLASGQIGEDTPLILGYSDGGPVHGTRQEITALAIGGKSQTGKSTTTRYIAANPALLGTRAPGRPA